MMTFYALLLAGLIACSAGMLAWDCWSKARTIAALRWELQRPSDAIYVDVSQGKLWVSGQRAHVFKVTADGRTLLPDTPGGTSGFQITLPPPSQSPGDTCRAF